MSLLLPLLFGCSPSAIPLGSVAEAVEHAEAGRLALTAMSVKEARGVAVVDTPDGPREVWVVPVRDVHGTLGQEVTLWLTPPQLQEVGDTPEIWYSRLVDRFDDHARTLRVTARVGDASTNPVLEAVRAAESAHGLRSAPGAPVVVYPER